MDDLAEIRRGMEDMELRQEAMLRKVVDGLTAIATASGNTSTVTVNAGGIGVWIATTACCVMLAVSVILTVLVVDQQRQIDDLGDYLNAIYMQAPHLKPEKSE